MDGSRKVTIYDTTLRDGAQGEGVSFSLSGRLRLLERLDRFGVAWVEGGCAGSNPAETEFFRQAKRLPLRQAKVVAFGSTRRKRRRVQDDPYVAALLAAGTPATAVFGKCWRFHARAVLRASDAENRAMIADTVAYLRERGREVFFDAEHFFDGFRDDPDFALAALRAAADAGAGMLVLCDTNGGSLPHEVREATRAVVEAFPRVPVAIHAHNDAGLAVANSLEAVRAGARCVQGTVNGYGERCGNANLCAIVPNLQLKMGLSCVPARRLGGLRELSLFVDDLVNLRPDGKSPYVGASAFSHKAGPHADAVGKDPRTFEHVPPAAVGNERRILVSGLSGGSSVLLKAVELGVGRGVRSRENTREVLRALKDLENRGYAFEAADASFHLLIQKVLREHRSFFELEGFRVIVEKRGRDEPCLSEATIKVRVRDDVEITAAEGDGPVNALDKALRKALLRFYPDVAQVFLTDFRVRILDPQDATAAKTRVLIESSDGRETWGTVGVSGNIIEASWEALVDSVEYKLFREEEKRRGRTRGRRRRRSE